MALPEPSGIPVVTRRLTKPFSVWVCESGLTGIRPGLIPPPESVVWRSEGTGATYDNDCERGKRTTRESSHMPVEIRGLFSWLRSDEMMHCWSALTGISELANDPTLHGGGLHVVAGGGWLNTHLDYARHPIMEGFERRINLILFLNDEWKTEWGGAFEVCRPDGSVVERIYPAPGRVIAFETSDVSYHGIQRTAPDAPERVSLAVYYLTPARPSATRVRALFLPNRGQP